jgi:hypothetical protein
MNRNQLYFTVPKRILIYLESQLKDNPHSNMSNLIRSYFVRGFGADTYNLVKDGRIEYDKDNQ